MTFTPVQLNRAAGSVLDTKTFLDGQLVADQTAPHRPRIGDGATLGGIKLALLSDVSGQALTESVKTGDYNILDADKNTRVVFSKATAVNGFLPAIAGTTPNTPFRLRNAGLGPLTISAAGSDTFDDGTTSILLGSYEEAVFWSNGTVWRADRYRTEGSVAPETVLASAATTDIGSTLTERVNITGTTAITSFGTQPRKRRVVRFSGALTLTHNTTSLILPGAANITTAAGDIAEFLSDGSGNWRCAFYTAAAGAGNFSGLIRELLAANRTYYVRTDGSDSNNGLSDSTGGAFATWQKAMDVASTLDFNGKTVTVQHGAESGVKTFTAPVTINKLTGGGSLVIAGSSTPGNTIFNVSGSDPFNNNDTEGHVYFQNMTLMGGVNGCIFVAYRSIVQIGSGVIFGAATNAHIYVHDSQAQVLLLNTNYSITGGGNYHIEAVNGAHVFHELTTVTLTGTPNFSGGFVSAVTNGSIQSPNSTFNGAATGPRFSVSIGGVINTLGRGLNYFPGSLPGIRASGGQYDAIDDYGPWTAYTPSVSPAGGAFTTFGGASGRYLVEGKKVTAKVVFSITNNGTGSSSILVQLPIAPLGVESVAGRESTSTGKAVIASWNAGTTLGSMTFFDGTYPGVNGGTYSFSLTYEIA